MLNFNQMAMGVSGTNTTNTASSSPSSSGSSTGGGGAATYSQSQQQQPSQLNNNQNLQYSLLYKNYLQPFLQSQYYSNYAGTTGTIPNSTSMPTTGHYYSNTPGIPSGSAVHHATYLNGSTTGNMATSSRSSSNSSSSHETGANGANHGLYNKSTDNSAAIMSDASTNQQQHHHHHGHHHSHHHQHSEYEQMAYQSYPMAVANTPSANAYAASIASMARF